MVVYLQGSEGQEIELEVGEPDPPDGTRIAFFKRDEVLKMLAMLILESEEITESVWIRIDP
jgi:hypothetical protein